MNFAQNLNNLFLFFQDDLDSVSTVGNQQRTPTNSIYGSVPLAFAGGSALIETLQSSLKQRDGENHQLQWELSRLQSERNFLLSEVSTLTVQLEGVSYFQKADGTSLDFVLHFVSDPREIGDTRLRCKSVHAVAGTIRCNFTNVRRKGGRNGRIAVRPAGR